MLSHRAPALTAPRLLLVILAAALLTGAASAAPPAKDILRRALNLHEGVQDYTAQVQAEIRAPEGADLHGEDRVQTIAFKVLFKRPDKVKIEANRPVVMPKQLFVFGNLGTLVAQNADVTLIGEKTENGVPIYAIKAVRRGGGGGSILFWINGENWTVQRMQIPVGGPNGGLDLNVVWTYTQVQGFYVPQRIAVSLPKVMFGEGAQGNGEASLTMTNWKINVGLEDKQFE